jgi:hypothetical protein
MESFVTLEKLLHLRRRLAIGADSAMTGALSRLWENEAERCVAIQKKIGSLTRERAKANSPLGYPDV